MTQRKRPRGDPLRVVSKDLRQRKLRAARMRDRMHMHSETHMNPPPIIQFDGIPRSQAAEEFVRSRVSQLERHFADLMGCRVTLSKESRHGQPGGFFSARVAVTLPGRELTVSHAHEEDAHIALRDAFDAIRRRLEDGQQIRRGEVKHHAAVAHRDGEDAVGE
ncbi:HPF/RaiA family ribosome-associated protein [Variovorax sp. HW608]|uniref:HPF/RaiA family ribosome-associated protein n=1 Tax=Variovorax sp. HW608 TaxID=1034889 RepID=UPI0012FDE833|nr:HPF/RaiA family ribosome-associated protein [Variovorax sp. HW608]